MNISNTRSRRALSSAFALVLSMQLVFPIQVLAIFGGGPKIPSPSKVAKELEQRYHINTESVQNFGEGFNVADSKKTTPELSIFFSPTDPKEGQKITAKAFPIYFSNESSNLYYTWYLKQSGCGKDSAVASGDANYFCDDEIGDGDGDIDVNDWKVAAARILVTNGADEAVFDYGSSTDSDGYSASFGGGNKVNTSGDWCYLADSNNGKLYELVTSASPDRFVCNGGYDPACVSGSDTVNPETFNASASASGGSGGAPDAGGSGGSSSVSITGQTFGYSSTYESVGSPDCKSDVPTCPSGSIARCVLSTKIDSTFDYNSDTAGVSCTSGSVAAGGSKCSFHLFPWPDTNLDGSIGAAEKNDSGDGSFGSKEEDFWGTNPNDVDTADNGNKDEANVVGLGRDTFTWNYQAGDMLGVVVEGTSMIATKHDDSSSAVMWAFSKNDCEVSDKSSYTQTIKGYAVTIPTTSMDESDVNACLEDNLIDPLESGQGNSKKLEVEVTASPENPMNDATGEEFGDVVVVNAVVSNSSRPISEQTYYWWIDIGASPNGTWYGMTGEFHDAGIIPYMDGDNTLPISLNITKKKIASSSIPSIDAILGSETFYLRVRSSVSENFTSGVSRKGASDVVIRVSNTDRKIVANTTSAMKNAVSGKYEVSATGQRICDEFYDFNALPSGITNAAAAQGNLNRIACRVMKNEVVAVSVDPLGLDDIKWTLNGAPIRCSEGVSGDPECINGNRVFFAVAGVPGETYTIRTDAVNVLTGKTLSLSRVFQIVEPEVVIESDDATAVWPKYVGSHTDLDGNTFDEYSDFAFETYAIGNIKMKARFLPSPAKLVSSDLGPDNAFGTADDVSRRIWMIDGAEVPETAPGSLAIDYAPVTPKAPGEVYNISFNALLVQPVEKRQALKDIWEIDTLASSEIRVSQNIQMDVVESEEIAQGPKKFLAAISSYLPASVLFAFRITISMMLLLFTVGFVFALIPAEPRTDEVILSRRG